MGVILKTFPDREIMSTALADMLAARLRRAVTLNKQASMAVSGGDTPKKMFQNLSTKELDWEKITITLADERWVDPASADSNESLLRNNLLQNNAAKAKFLALKTEHQNPEEGCKLSEEKLSVLVSDFDVVVLGMGDDGHTASLFPGADALPDAMDGQSEKSLIALTPKELPDHAPYSRLTMTLTRLLRSQLIVLLIAGHAKLNVYNSALLKGEINEMPIRGILMQDKAPVMVYWAP